MERADGDEPEPEAPAGGRGGGGVSADAQSARRAARLAAFAADALDWPAIRATFERHAPSSLGVRALAELVPRDDAGALAALARCRELCALDPASAPPLAGLTDPLPILVQARLYSRALEGLELARLGAFLMSARQVGAWATARAGAVPATAALLDGAPDCEELRAELDRCVDPRGRVLDEASARLRDVRRRAAQLEETVERRLRALVARNDVRRFLADGAGGRIQRRGGRAVLAVKAKHLGQVPGIVHDRSQTEETLFVEPQQVVESANAAAAARADERHEVERVLTELTRAVRADEAQIRRLAELCAEVELAACGASWARAHDGRPALVVGEPGAADELVLRAVRHPLLVEQERLGRIERVVPLDLRLGGDFDLIVITGPNTGGKTLALKTAGVAALLTRMGLPLAALAGTTVPLYDGVAADIGDEQEIEQNLSTFASHVVRIADALARATRRTLVLLDELGGGTDPDEGAALGDALLEELLGRGVPTLGSTHLGVLKEFAFRHERAENACVEFDAQTLAPLYRLLVGTPGESNALAIARRLGLDGAVVDRAERRLVRPRADVERLMNDVRRTRVAAEEVRGAAERRAAELEDAVSRLAEEEEAVRASRAMLAEEAGRLVEEEVRDVLVELERIERLLPQVPAGVRGELGGAIERARARLQGADLTGKRQGFLETLKKGELVYLVRYGRRAVVLKVDKRRRRLAVRLGKRELDVAFDEVSAYEAL